MNDNEFIVDLSLLDKDRPNGVSGLMRVKNDADFIRASVLSVIDCLDELIICYQKSNDNTEQEIKKLHEEFPDKIRVYYYAPIVYSHNLSDKELKLIDDAKLSSIHLLSNYYNYTLSKAKYRYGIKIDADQIYFTEKFAEICNLYKSEEKTRIPLKLRLSYLYAKIIRKTGCYIPFIINRSVISLLFPNWVANNIRQFVKRKIQNDKIICSFEGLNIYIKNNTVNICGGCFSDGRQPPIGGCGDHIFFPISSRSFYSPKVEYKYKRAIEVMRPFSEVYFGLGFLWLHLNALRNTPPIRNNGLYDSYLYSFGDFLSCRSLKKFRMPKFIQSIVMIDFKLDYRLLLEKSNLIKDQIGWNGE